ncbi:MAG TPA: hypothetical protein DCO68_08960 [Methylophilaceae bacterium]|nr:hypothetical protein [Methylophilaceae bacterium]HAJ72194.1 hypothetical protein [Methylophilaceae bacterium]
MKLFNKLPNSICYPSGVEWPLLKKLPFIFLIGTLLIGLPAISIFIQNSEINAEQYRTIYICFGLLFTFWFFVGVAAIGCVVVMIMKGPGYVADAYELPKENTDFEKPLD